MWLLHNETGDTCHYLCGESTVFVVGRGNVDISLTKDSSISREHAVLTLRQIDNKSIVVLEDKNSKYGTYVNNGIESKTRVAAGQEIVLNCGDSIRFGILLNKWTLSKKDICTATSAFTLNDKNKIKEIMKHLAGQYEETCTSSCTHLTVPNLTLTIKLVQALVANIAIVTIDYWIEVMSCINSHKPLPKEELFLPKQAEPLIKCDSSILLPRSDRKLIFANKIFIFLSSKQFAQFEEIIQRAQGKAILLQKTKLTKHQICQPGMLVVQYIRSNSSQSSQSLQSTQMMDDIEKFLQSRKLRLIPESEIGLAILFCSTDKHCNPSFDFKTNLLQSTPVTENCKVLAEETEEVVHSPEKTYLKKTHEAEGMKNFLQINVENSNNESSQNSDLEFVEPKELPKDNVRKNSVNFKQPAHRSLNTCNSRPEMPIKKLDDSILTYNTTKKRSISCVNTCNDSDSEECMLPAKKIQKNDDENDNLFCFENEENSAKVPKSKTKQTHQNTINSNKNEEHSFLRPPVSCYKANSNTSTTIRNISYDLGGWLSSNGNSMQVDDSNEKTINLSIPEDYQDWFNEMRDGINIERKKICRKTEHKIKENSYTGVNYKKFKKVRPLFCS